MVLLLIPLGILSLYGIRYVNRKDSDNPAKINTVLVGILFITTIFCEIYFIYSLLKLFGKTEGAVMAFSLLIPTLIYWIFILKFTSKVKKENQTM